MPSPQPLTNVRTQAPSDKPDFELRGTLNADYTYAHTATKRQSVSIVMATWDAESAQMACAVVPPDGTRFLPCPFYFASCPRAFVQHRGARCRAHADRAHVHAIDAPRRRRNPQQT